MSKIERYWGSLHFVIVVFTDHALLLFLKLNLNLFLSHDVESGSDITTCNEMNKPNV